MSQGKELEKKTHIGKTKSLVLLVSIALIIVSVVGTILAFLIDGTDQIINEFTPSEVTTEILEDLPGDVKNNVRIHNTGDTEAYIRADVFFTWKNPDTGVISSVLPVEGTDYTIDWSGTGPNGGWQQGIDGFYYHLAPVAAKTENDDTDETSILFTACQEVENAPNKPEGYVLSVEIIASGIQSVPTSVVTEMWSSAVDHVNEETKALVLKIATDIVEEFDGEIKNNVRVKNTGDADAYIRAAVVICWKHESDGSVYDVLPEEGTDYTITWSGIDDDSWKKGIDGFYYHLAPVAAENEDDTDETSVLFTNCYAKVDANKPDGYVLSVEIITSGIPSVPTSVVKEMWRSGVADVNEETKVLVLKNEQGGEG